MSDGRLGAKLMEHFRESRKNRYQSGLLHDRWTITEMSSDCYCIHDHEYYEQFVRAANGLTLYFPSIAAAEAHVVKLSGRKLEPGIGPNMTYKVYTTKKHEVVLAPASLPSQVVFLGCFMEDDQAVLRTKQLSKAEFSKTYSPVKANDYPPEKLAQIHLQYLRALGGDAETLELLGDVITIDEKDREMATKKTETTAKKAPAKKTAAKKAPAKKTTAKKAPAKKTAAKTEKPASKAIAKTKKEAEQITKRPSAKARFDELLMTKAPGGKTCKYTDDEIFAMIQKEFDLPDDRRKYVSEYRSKLRRSGANPPAAKK